MASKTSAGSDTAELHSATSGDGSEAFFAIRARSTDRAFHARVSRLPFTRGNAAAAARTRSLTTPRCRLVLHEMVSVSQLPV